jgi:hypothetical protein
MPEAEHAGALAPVLDDLLSVRRLQIEMPENAEFVRVRLDRLDRELVDLLAQGGGRMDDGRVNPGLGHLLQRVVLRIGRDLPVMRRHPAVFPDVDLRIDDQHRVLSRSRL